ncbi:MAG: sigma factor-like helix-turn-helix DNA-binding protein [Acidimicrobiia bacterium]
MPQPAFAAGRLRQGLVARYGWELGIEAWHDAVSFAWEHANELSNMSNPTGYLYRVAQTSVRRQRRADRRFDFPSVGEHRLPDVEPKLPAALAALPERQRIAVMLVHGHGWTQREAADTMGIAVSSLRNHIRRGLERLRRELGVDDG